MLNSFPFARSLALGGALAAALVAFSPRADAQCFGGDGLSSAACCGPTLASLPPFPAMSWQGSGLCWTDCNLSGQVCTKTVLGAPSPVTCAMFDAPLEVYDCTSGAILLKGNLRLDYTRTWQETKIPGAAPSQVWRFAAKVDMAAPATGTPICPVPTCASSAGATAFYYGYVDWSLDCATGLWEGALVLYHGCDEFMHKPILSSVPGVFHPTTTYALVAPDNAANPFSPSIWLPPAGPLTTEALRHQTPNATGMCTTEERIVQGQLATLGTACLCPFSFQPPQNAASKLSVSGFCGGAVQSLNVYPAGPWIHMISTSIGNWTGPLAYPGVEGASVMEGLVLYTDVCDPFGIVVNSFDILYGSVTQGGWTIVTAAGGGPLPDRLVDLASNYSVPITAPLTFPVLGSVSTTDHLLYVGL